MNSQTALSLCSLPNELLDAIAAAGQEGCVSEFQDAFKSKWTLSHVSHRLREVVVGAPTLWTVIRANLGAEGSVEIFKLYVERAGVCELWADIRSFSRAEDHRVLVTERLAQIVLYVNRMRRLSIVLPPRWGHVLLAPFRYIAAPVLQHLEIVQPENFNHDFLRVPFELFFVRGPKADFPQNGRPETPAASASVDCIPHAPRTVGWPGFRNRSH
ncbi:hypothetical protein B0H19DRAFT_202340 [Mycena capillaripes]|nr:hypothetical protein B0H19DRAFT_202340 [Mycena capillaripes]